MSYDVVALLAVSSDSASIPNTRSSFRKSRSSSRFYLDHRLCIAR